MFGLSGGLAGAKAGLDVFGILVVASVVGIAGDVTRDLFLGIPAMVVFDWREMMAVVAAGLLAFVAHRPLSALDYPIQIFDAIGLALFSIIGANASLAHRATALAAALLGMLTGIAGGVVRDIVLREIPAVLQSGLYAVPSLVGSGLGVLGYQWGILGPAWFALAVLSCLGLRLGGIFFDLNLPRSR